MPLIFHTASKIKLIIYNSTVAKVGAGTFVHDALFCHWLLDPNPGIAAKLEQDYKQALTVGSSPVKDRYAGAHAQN